MKKTIFKNMLSITLMISAIFIIGSSCGTPSPDDQSWYLDRDGDGFGTREDVNWLPPPQPAGYADNPDDCDDTNADVNPNAVEISDNEVDEDCNALVAYTFYKDRDGDGFGDLDASTIIEIEFGGDAPDGLVFIAGDCNDDDNLINPLANEVFGNNIDDNCNGETDTDERYIDTDGDGYGSTNLSAAAGVFNNIDCDDNDLEVHPYSIEILNDGMDSNCDGTDNN